jgi:hypothetical protein
MFAKHATQQLKQSVYNVTSFNLSADEIAPRAVGIWNVDIKFLPEDKRQAIDSWPTSMIRRHEEIGAGPEYDQARLVYLIPGIKERYRASKVAS